MFFLFLCRSLWRRSHSGSKPVSRLEEVSGRRQRKVGKQFPDTAYKPSKEPKVLCKSSPYNIRPGGASECLSKAITGDSEAEFKESSELTPVQSDFGNTIEGELKLVASGRDMADTDTSGQMGVEELMKFMVQRDEARKAEMTAMFEHLPRLDHSRSEAIKEMEALRRAEEAESAWRCLTAAFEEEQHRRKEELEERDRRDKLREKL